MNSNRKQVWEYEARRAFAAAGHDWQRLITHVNHRIVPEVRTGAATAMQSLAAGLRRTADWLDANRGPGRV
jgi:hypothetical protein